MKAKTGRYLGTLAMLAFTGLVQAEIAAHRPTLTVLWPQNAQSSQAHAEITHSGLAEAVIDMAEQRMALKSPVTLVLGGGGEPRINTRSQVIVMPYEHLQHIKDDLKISTGQNVADTSVALDAFVYSMVHQLAHVAITQQEETGQWLGEDAVADLTMLTLLEHMPNGDRIAQNALSLFDKHAIGLNRSKSNYWASHSLNAERYWSGICQLHGSGRSFDEVMPAEQMSDAECGDHYALLRNSWAQMFAEGLEPLAENANVASR